ncbi:MAG TPA: glycosyltransferase family 4 protein [Candidatus Angelobacter sp.]|nr:glycosyltransferase family 4 protein [Candidatus Angelobacter sp.]
MTLMKIALVAPPFIAVPPRKYGGTELFIAHLARGLQAQGTEVTVYTIGESTIEAPIRWLYRHGEWPLPIDVDATLKGLNHSSWAIKEAAQHADIIHLNSAPGLSFSRFVEVPIVQTVHHAYEQKFAEYYQNFPDVSYVTISDFQREKLRMPRMRTIHHGIEVSLYPVCKEKQPYLSFLGRIAPTKGTHLAIEVAKKSGIPLKIGGEIQPMYKGYWDTVIKPQVDGKFIEYLGEMALHEKIELLGNSLAMIFPVQWDEPFGLVMIEAMACGTPVLATPGGSVREIVKEGLSGHIRPTTEELAKCARELNCNPEAIRVYMEEHFSLERMTRDYINLYTEILQNGVKEVEQIVA